MRSSATAAAAASFLLITGMAFSASAQNASSQATYEITIVNVTNDQIFSNPVVATHKPAASIFRAGDVASEALRMLAEDGVTADLELELSTNPDVLSIAVAADAILPGASATFQVTAQGDFDRLSAVGMLVSTNDAFFGLDTFDIDHRRFNTSNVITMLVPAYDAGTETNNESCAYIPGPPCENPFNRDTAGAEGSVRVHRGVQGGVDLDPTIYDFRNPVAKIIIRRLS